MCDHHLGQRPQTENRLYTWAADTVSELEGDKLSFELSNEAAVKAGLPMRFDATGENMSISRFSIRAFASCMKNDQPRTAKLYQGKWEDLDLDGSFYG
jgi:uncharacterized protein YcsI (UPF0317 family)